MKKKFTRWLSIVLIICMMLSVVAPVTVFAADDVTENVPGQDAVATEEATGDVVAASEETTDDDSETDEPATETYESFLANLKLLQGYAESYYATNTANDVNELMLNYIRTGVDRYLDGNWKTLAGEELTAFVTYVAQQDEANGTSVTLLRNLEEFTIPNGQTVDFGHMFGAMNIAYVASQTTANSPSADLGGWAGDICDLMMYSKDYGYVPEGTVDEKAAFILQQCFGVDADNAFGMDDFYGDMDGYYFIAELKAGADFSELVEAYYTEALTDADRAAYFMNNRFSGLETKEDVRNAVYNTYAGNVGLQVLEADRGLTEESDLRYASCYAFADYLFSLAGDRLEGGSEGGDSGEDGEEGGEEDGSEPGGEDGEGNEEGGEDEDTGVNIGDLISNDYYTDFSVANSTLAPGITQTVKYALTSDNQQIAYYLATIDVTRDDVSMYANYKDNDPSAGWGMQRLTDQMAAAEKNHSDPEDTENYIENYTAVAGINADFYNMSTGSPSGALVMEGVTYKTGNTNFFAILKDGTPVIGSSSEWSTYVDQVQEAVGGSIIFLKDGEYVGPSGVYYTEKGPRSCIGITADGKVVMLVIDGRQAPFSAGATVRETAQILLDAGCVDALHLDGGGSATYAAKPEGSDDVKVISSPSDGYERSVSSSLVAVSTAKSSKEFDHANITSEYEYLTIGTELTLTAVGVSNTGNSAPLPENAVWQVSDETIGTVTEDGVFTAAANGDVEVQLAVEGVVVGAKTIHVVVPDTLVFEKEEVIAIYGVPTTLPLVATYNGNPVAYNKADILFATENSDVGTFDGNVFTGNAESGIRKTMCVALLEPDYIAYAMTYISLYDESEAIFDFDTATAGNRTLAWKREVSNATTTDEKLYQVIDPEGEMETEYTFALDMTQIEIPAQLQDITYMLPGADAGATAWDFLLQLAERVSVLTEVKVTAKFDADVVVDYSALKVVNDYFYLKNATLDEATNTLTITCGWVDQTAAIDPATANPICILSGLKLTTKDGAVWDSDDQLDILNSGEVSYKIYLRANALYSFSNIAANQQQYGLYPFENPDVIVDGATEKGAYFGSSYTTFEDAYTLDKTSRQGWYEIDKQLYYFVDNVALTGVQKLPGYEDPTTDYIYQFGEDGICAGTVTGMVELEGHTYYAVLGEIMTGWRTVMDSEGNTNYYFFNRSTGAAVDGVQNIDGYTYTFNDKVLTKGQFVQDSTGCRYRWAGTFEIGKWFEVDGNEYYATYPTGYLATGFMWIKDHDGINYERHLFDENGVWQKDFSGIYNEGDDSYLIDKGILIQEPGLVYIDGYYYYFASNGKAVKDRIYWPSKTNGLLPIAAYYFDEQGRMVNPPVIEQPEEPEPDDTETPTYPETPVKDGLVSENGGVFYYKNGVLQYCAGLIQVDGDYYYIRSNGQAAVGNYWVTNHNGLMAQGMYTFGADGKMVLDGTEPEEPDSGETETPVVKDGFVSEYGAIYYYKNGAIQYCAGLIYVDGYYYYVRSNGQLATGKYWPTNHNDLLPPAVYTFDEQGRMIDPPTEAPEEPDTSDKNGLVSENGSLYYYVDGVKQTDLGLIELSGSYYYVRSGGELAIGEYWVDKTNGLVEAGLYTFGTDGKLIIDEGEDAEQPETTVKNGIVDVNGVLYYYENDAIAYCKGVVQLEDGAYIYVRSNGQLATGVYWPTNTNDLLPSKGYDWGTDGKLYL